MNDVNHDGVMNETGNSRGGNARKRKTQFDQTGPYKKWRKKKQGGQKNQHQQKDGWRPANRGGGHPTRPPWGKVGRYSKNKNDKQDVQEKPKRLMSQDFKDQNGLVVDGRLVCRHFVFGRCIKGDDCQLEHIEAYNDIVKEVCKFYVQAVCTKGESCPYMHKSFPCKYFHSKGKCSQGADCRFSHEPLNDVTNRLLCEALKREDDLFELRKKAELKASGQPENTEESEIIEANSTSDTLLQSLRPNFYNSEETNAAKETAICQTDDLADVMEEAVPPHASGAAQPHIPPSSNLTFEEPVCYSVAAVLGPQLFKPFPSFCTTPGSQESATSGSASQSEAPYSVDSVLRSYKSVENSTLGHTPTPPTAQTVSYTPKTDFEEITDPPLSSETHKKKVLYSVNTRKEPKKSQENMSKSLSSLQVHTGLISKTCPSPTLASEDYKKQGGNMPECLNPAQRAAHEVKVELEWNSAVTEEERSASSENKGAVKGSEHLNTTDITCSVNCKSEGVIPFGCTNRKSISSRPAGQMSAPRRPTQLMPPLSVLASDSQASMKPFYPSSGFTEFKGGSAVPVGSVTCSMKTTDSADSVSCHFAAEQPTVKPVEPDKTSARPFLSLFATHLPSIESLDYSSCSQHSNLSVRNTSQLSNSKQRANLEARLPGQVRTDFKEIPHVAKSPSFSPNPNIRNEDNSTEHVNRPRKQLVSPVCSLVSDSLGPAPCDNSPSTTHAHLHSKKTTAGLKCGAQHQHSPAVTADSSSKTAGCVDLAPRSKKSLKRPFHSLFTSPISDTLKPIDASVTDSSCPQGVIQSSCSPKSTDYRSNLVKNATEPDKTSARPFLGLFATPLPSIESLEYSRISSCSQHSNQSVKKTSQLSNSKQRASNLETPLPGQVRTDFKENPHAARSPSFCPSTGNEDNSTEHVNQPRKQLVNPVCSLVSDSLSPTPCGNNPSTTHAHQQLPDISTHKGSGAAATADSVLRTPFLCLGLNQEDGKQQDSRSDQCPSRLSVQQPTGKMMSRSPDNQRSLQTPHISLSSSGTTEPQVRNSPGTPVAPLMQHHTRPRQKTTSEEETYVNGDVVATPFRDLFKTLDTVFHGH